MVAEQEPTRSASPLQTETGRLEAFSDGVFAVAITLLALNVAVPLAGGHPVALLGTALLDQWPSYLAYLVSFITILIMWVNHHAMFLIIRKTDHTFLILNGMLLLVITAIPFGTSLLATYLRQSPTDRQIVQGVYCGLQLLLAVFYNAMLGYATRRRRLLGDDVPAPVVRTFIRQYTFGPLLYGIAFLIDGVSAAISLALCVVLSLFFALPQSITYRIIHFGRAPATADR